VKLVYYGSSDFSVPVLEALINSPHEVVLVITQPDKKKGRGQKMIPTEVKEFAMEHGIPVWTPPSLRGEDFDAEIRTVQHDVAVVASYGKIVPANILDIPKFGYMNVHSSLLPKYRGASPMHGALLNGDTITGVSIMQMDVGLDTGAVMMKTELPILPEDDIATISAKLADIGGKDMVTSLDLLEKGEAVFIPQNDAEVTHTKKIKKEHSIIDWQESAATLMNKDRAYRTWPGLNTQFRGKDVMLEGLKLVSEEELDIDKSFLEKAECGTIVCRDKKTLVIKTGKGLVKPAFFKVAGKNKVEAQSFIAGYQPKLGDIFRNKHS